jgi:restriction system protein
MASDDDGDDKKNDEPVSDHFGDYLRREWATLILVEGETDAKVLNTVFRYTDYTDGKRERIVITTPTNLTTEWRRYAVNKELRHYFKAFTLTDPDLVTTKNFNRLLGELVEEKKQRVDLSVSSVIVPERKVTEGVLIKATSVVWSSVLEELEKHDWKNAHEIPSRVWEEIVAGAFVKAGFSEVILTPRSGDHGRDVIAIKNGIGSIKVLDSVKAYKPGHLVTKEEVHALMGVVAIDPNASKGILTTTSDFAPKLLEDPRLAQALPHRLELMNGVKLRKWLKELADKK